MALGPEVIKQIHERMVQIASDHRVAAGRRMRLRNRKFADSPLQETPTEMAERPTLVPCATGPGGRG